MIDQPPDPSFKGTLTPEGADFLKYLEKPVIQDQQRFILITGIFYAHGHHSVEVALIQLLLTPAVISNATLYELMF